MSTVNRKRTLILNSENCQLWGLLLLVRLAGRQHSALGNLVLPPTLPPYPLLHRHTITHTPLEGNNNGERGFLCSFLLPRVRGGAKESLMQSAGTPTHPFLCKVQDWKLSRI